MVYSQNNEQEIILSYFKDKIGTFLDCGANDGETFSNVRALALKGWKGVLIEPHPEAFKRLKKLYPRNRGGQIYCYEVAIGDFIGKHTLSASGSLCSVNDIGLVSTFHKHEIDRFKKTVGYEQIEVKMSTWKTFSNRLMIKEFDCISLDCEGSELYDTNGVFGNGFIYDMDFSKTSLVVVEWNGNKSYKDEYEKVLQGFNIIYTSGENLIFGR